ncbi:DUF3108 domain-containing protein [Tabrizicola sp. DMG-N-6]|uniref:DUF3108 domain-containing protein n=2 Tax=Szabonella alba TaxID=2804194 RepID=A0A8K0Y1L0_9RHOB|nr:DUF3108 domain-containing protein [Szabonella alba]
MIRRRFPAIALAATLGLAVATPMAAQSARIEDRASFDIILRGITAGRLSIAAAQEGSRYSVSGRLESTGIAAMLRRFQYTAEAGGSITQGRYAPARYSENADTGRRQSRSSMEFRGGRPANVVNEPARDPRPYDVDPATMRGAVDPVTALYATLRDVDAGGECAFDQNMFDGRRATRITLSAPQRQGDTVTCSGVYSRVAGFSPEDMAEKTRFPFTLTYAPAGDGRMRVVEVSTDTLYGKALMKRR